MDGQLSFAPGIDSYLPRILCGRFLVAVEWHQTQGHEALAVKAMDAAIGYMAIYSTTQALQLNRSVAAPGSVVADNNG
jgi:hypothetical protein